MASMERNVETKKKKKYPLEEPCFFLQIQATTEKDDEVPYDMPLNPDWFIGIIKHITIPAKLDNWVV